ncbi:MAG: N-acetylmuramoyl-L-alanine amidase, partial [Lachnospiraceae bacterium]|nr:N-acetylmuramoyl-L-alanine amidase [Lachnospiraceae bacterium]
LPYRVRVTIPDLNVRKGPGRLFGKNGVTGIGVFTITEEKNGWGKLKSGAGWICLSYTQRI